MPHESDKHGARADDTLAEEYERGQREALANTVRGHDEAPEPSSLSPDEIQARRELARHLQPSAFPADREALLKSAGEMQAPPEVMSQLRELPDGEFENAQAIWDALGGTHETHESHPKPAD
ncbi:MAG TPA: DUF2795 domain-containing protein [Actinomycetota bacterium]|nr:DUF2795 domain-containing protein [Actinomycetota bacterium]